MKALGAARVRAILAGGGRAGLAALFLRDRALAAEFKAVSELDRLCATTGTRGRSCTIL